MSRSRLEHYAAGLLITSILLIVVCQCWALYRGQISAASLLLVTGTFAGIAGLGIAAQARMRTAIALPVVEVIRDPQRETAQPPAGPRDAQTALLHMLEQFFQWRLDLPEQMPPLPAFDQMLREMLTARLNVSGVRCYRVLPDGALAPLAQSAECAHEVPVDETAHDLLVRVVTAPDRSVLDPLPAASGTPGGRWAFGVTQGTEVVGLVTAGRIHGLLFDSTTARQSVSALVTLFWRKVLLIEQLRLTCRTDGASGVLRRQMFFERAREALRQSLECSEPVVLAVIGLEGLRRLDDGGQWRARDELIERIGRLILERSRTDDVVGRFSDDRFVLLLRRMDTNLARLVMGKLATAATAVIVRSGPPAAPDSDGAPHGSVGVRVGLAGTGTREMAFETLLIAGLGALDQARALRRPMWSDIDDVPAEALAHEG